MTLPREEIEKGLTEELSALSALVRPLTTEELAALTRCEGWTVADVCAHVAGTMTDILAGRLDGLGTPEATQRAVDERKGRTSGELAAEVDTVLAGGRAFLSAFDDAAWNGPAPAGLAASVGAGVETLWFDAFVHNDDIRQALGRPPLPTSGIRASISHLAQALSDQGWGPATLHLDGMEAFKVSGGGDRTVAGDPMTFILAATGRLDPATIGLDETVNVYR